MRVVVLMFLMLAGLQSSLALENEKNSVIDEKEIKRLAYMFGDVDDTSGPEISPDGKHLAYFVYNEDDKILQIMELGADKKVVKTTLSESETLKFTWYKWASNGRLLVGIYRPSNGRQLPTMNMIGVNADGSNMKVLVVPKKKRVRRYQDYNPFLDRLADILPNDPDHILAYYSEGWVDNPDVYKVNIHTAEMTLHAELPKEKGLYKWYADGDGEVRLGFLTRRRKSGIMMVRDDTNEWRKLDLPDLFEEGKFSVAGFAEDRRYVYVVSSFATGRAALFKFDLKTAKLAEKVFEHDEVDIRGVLQSPATGKPVAIRYLKHELELDFFDKGFKRFYRGIRKALGKSFRITSMSYDEKWAVVKTSAPTEPGAYYILDRQKSKMEAFHFAYEHLPADILRPMEHMAYEARDALKINAYITYPELESRENLPLIVMPHGGPRARDFKRWDYEVQYLANLGYAVMQPNFRGSTGYGTDFMIKGDGEWADGMLNDLVDGVDHLVDAGIVDKDRVCIMGASYGGYAALQSAVKHSDTFKCAISMAGISDIKSMLKYDGLFNKRNRYYQHVVGDRPKSKVKELSPITFIKTLDIPVLLGHGLDDEVVEAKQSEKFYKAANKFKKNVTLHTYEGEEHGLRVEANRRHWLREVGVFLQRHNPSDAMISREVKTADNG